MLCCRACGAEGLRTASAGRIASSLAEMLDTSTQSALRRLLPLTFDGFVQLHNSAVETRNLPRDRHIRFDESEFKIFSV